MRRFLVIIWFAAFSNCFAQPDANSTGNDVTTIRRGLYGSLGLGAGNIYRTFGSDDPRSINFAMHLGAGYFITPWLQAGVSFGGWTFRPANYTYYSPAPYPIYDVEKEGTFLSTNCLHLALYPFTKSRAYLKSGYGMSKFTNGGRPEERGRGGAFFAAAGYEWYLKGALLAGVEAAYHRGGLADRESGGVLYRNRNYHCVEVTVTVSID